MFKKIGIRNFRAITDLQVDNLARVNLFVGRNASGKTTLLESIFFMIGATNPRLPVSVNTFRGLAWVSKALWRTYFHDMNTEIPIMILAEESESGEEEFLVIRAREDSLTRPTEETSSSLSASWTPMATGTGAQINGLRLEYRRSFASIPPEVSEVYLKGEEIVVEGAKEPPARGTFVIPIPRDASSRFSEIQRKKQIPEIVCLLKEIEPAIEDLRLGDPGPLLYADIGAPELMPVDLMGGGAAKFLNVALAMLDFQNGFVLIDEIENGLHHSAQNRLWNAIFAWAQRLNVQVFASTHSMECIRAFNDCAERTLFGSEAKLFRIERTGDRFRTVEYTRELLSESLESDWEVR